MIRLGLGDDPTRPLDVLCIGAHSDDIEIGCGGAILRLLAERAGSRVTWVVFSANADREHEARQSAGDFLADAAEARVEIHHFRESYFPDEWAEVKDCFNELGRRVEPDIVFSHRRHDEHQDHRTVAELTWNTFRRHLILEYEIPKYDGDLGAPTVFAPLDAAVAEDKVRHILECYKSQSDRHWFSRDVFMALMRLRAMEANAGTDQAEAFYGRKVVLTAGAAGRRRLG